MPLQQAKTEDISAAISKEEGVSAVAKAADSATLEDSGKLLWVSPHEVKAGDTFELLLQAQGAKGVRTLPVNLHYAQNLFQVVTVEQGEPSGTTS